MAREAGKSPSDLKADLLKKGREFSFYQAIRLLRIFSGCSGTAEKMEGHGAGEYEYVRIRPELSLGFPASDITGIEVKQAEPPLFLMTASFLGLYGASSPLPTFYTEDLINEASEDSNVTRDFIDILNHRIYVLLFQCWMKYRQDLQLLEGNSRQDLERLFCLIGLGEKELREDSVDSFSLIRYAGLIAHFPRSAAGLERLLSDALNDIPVEVDQCALRKVKIPPEQRIFLGLNACSLGSDSLMGEEIEDQTGKFRLRLGPMNSREFNALLPGNPGHRKMVFLTKFYVTDPLEFDITLILAQGEARPVRLGYQQWSRIGLDTWLHSAGPMGEVSVTLRPQ
jgi:type VI secretion system protein ImpH